MRDVDCVVFQTSKHDRTESEWNRQDSGLCTHHAESSWRHSGLPTGWLLCLSVSLSDCLCLVTIWLAICSPVWLPPTSCLPTLSVCLSVYLSALFPCWVMWVLVRLTHELANLIHAENPVCLPVSLLFFLPVCLSVCLSVSQEPYCPCPWCFSNFVKISFCSACAWRQHMSWQCRSVKS